MFKSSLFYKVVLPMLALAIWGALVVAPASASAASATGNSYVDHRAHLSIPAPPPCIENSVQTCAPAHTLPGCALACNALPTGALFDLPDLSFGASILPARALRPGQPLFLAGRSLSPEPFPPRFASSL